MSDIEGSCHCGSIKIRIIGGLGENAKGAACHCTDCQLLSGSLFAYAGKVDRKDLQVVHGQPKPYKQPAAINLSGKQVTRYFCGDCGTPLWVESDATPTFCAVKLALFGNNFEPALEIFWKSAHGWETPMVNPQMLFNVLPPTMPPSA